jgi:hypothetical protein
MNLSVVKPACASLPSPNRWRDCCAAMKMAPEVVVEDDEVRVVRAAHQLGPQHVHLLHDVGAVMAVPVPVVWLRQKVPSVVERSMLP